MYTINKTLHTASPELLDPRRTDKVLSRSTRDRAEVGSRNHHMALEVERKKRD